MLQLNNLMPLVQKRKRIGRGGSRGGTSGRGNKGQKARSGSSNRPIQYEGGQMPLVRRLPKRGFNNKNFKTVYAIINISQLENNFEQNNVINKETLYEKGLLKKSVSAIKILGNGALSKKFTVCVDACSQTALEAIQRCGGEVQLIKEM